jgi:hypothetical protein
MAGPSATGPFRPSIEGSERGTGEDTGQRAGAIFPSHSKREEGFIRDTVDPRKRWKDGGLEFALNWVVKVLALSAAILFGIWAPLSYHQTASANDNNTQAQNTANAQAASALSIQSSVADMQSSVANMQSRALDGIQRQASSALIIQSFVANMESVALDGIQSRARAVGQLLLLDFCVVQTVCS